MDNARVGIFEDNGSWHGLLTDVIEGSGHSVVVAARSMNEAHIAIDGLKEDSLDVAVVDGNLGSNTDKGADGAEITRLLREKVGAITVIGLSATDEIAGVDRSVDKAGTPFEEIPAIIAEL